MIVTISQKTNKPLCWNIINLGLQYNIWLRYIYPNSYTIFFYFFFFFTKYKNECKERKFCKQKNQKEAFYKNEKVTNIDDIDVIKILFSKEDPYGTKIHLNTLFDTIIMMLLDHYA